MGDRRLEEKVLPLAQERKIGVLAYFAFDRGRLFKRAGATPFPEWAHPAIPGRSIIVKDVDKLICWSF